MQIPDQEEDRRLYRIQNQVEYFGAGRTQDGHQILLGVQLPELVLIEFDKVGNYLHTTTKILPDDAMSWGAIAMRLTRIMVGFRQRSKNYNVNST